MLPQAIGNLLNSHCFLELLAFASYIRSFSPNYSKKRPYRNPAEPLTSGTRDCRWFDGLDLLDASFDEPIAGGW
jgi:hypothetical protein